MKEVEGIPVYINIIDEIRAITANKVAEIQKEEDIKFPEIIKKIKETAALGVSKRSFNIHDFGEYTKKLLEVEGFKVSLEKAEYDYRMSALNRLGTTLDDRIWVIKW